MYGARCLVIRWEQCLEGFSRALRSFSVGGYEAKKMIYYEVIEKNYETFIKINEPVQLSKEHLLILIIEKSLSTDATLFPPVLLDQPNLKT